MFTKSNKYDFDFAKENMMGPNSMKILEEVSESLKLEKGMRILDLGCGRGLTSIFLAKEYDVTVFATDL
ncbi:MAG: class I SAM-dependent methyltransferase, partial [Methanosarcina vacuolata]|nr:class I SAM-dependent methyltransferase [Methanosarcina vacuolata]